MVSGKLKKNSGFTFVELLLTLFILSICFVPLMSMFSTALVEIAYIDDMKIALDLAREEIEKVKNLSLTEKQIKKMGNVASPPVYLNKKVWRAIRVVNQDVSPLQFSVYVYRADSLDKPLMYAITIVSK